MIGRTLEVGTVHSGEPLSEPGRDPSLGSDERGKRRDLVQDVGDDLDGTAKDSAKGLRQTDDADRERRREGRTMIRNR